MRILQVIPALQTGGAEQGCVSVAQAIRAAGGQAIVASTGGAMVSQLDRAGALHLTLPVADKAPLAIWRAAGLLTQAIRDHGIDVIHARSRAPAWAAWLAARRAGIPFVTTYHGTYNARSAPKRLYNSVMARGDRVIAISDFIADHVRATYPWAADRLVTIPRGIDLERFHPDAVDRERVDAVLAGWPEQARTARRRVLLPGRLTAWKGQRLLIEAMALLPRPKAKQMAVILAGDDQGRSGYRSELEARISAAGLAGLVHLVGPVADVPAAMAACDVIVSASTEPEAFGRVVMEAQAIGRAIVAPNHGAAPQLMMPDGAHAVFMPGDATALRAAVESLIALPGRDLSAATRAAVDRIHHPDSPYSEAAMTGATLAIYGELMAAK